VKRLAGGTAVYSGVIGMTLLRIGAHETLSIDGVVTQATTANRADTGNVIPFLPAPRRSQAPAPTLGLTAAAADRPTPPAGVDSSWWHVTLLAGSMAAHAAVIVALNSEPAPLASIGVQSISVDIVLGANVAAAKYDTVEPLKPEVAQEAMNARDDAVPTKPDTAQPAPPTRPAELTSAYRLEALSTPAVPERAVVPLPPRPKVHRDRRPTARPRQSTASTDAVAPTGTTRGRSDADTNYRGLVAAQLARNKNFPLDARRNGEEGNAVISFNIDGEGRVTHVALVRGSGFANLDHEAQAMVRRASPFPPPPAGRPMRFTAPISFNIR
jgi:TonB family protein